MRSVRRNTLVEKILCSPLARFLLSDKAMWMRPFPQHRRAHRSLQINADIVSCSAQFVARLADLPDGARAEWPPTPLFRRNDVKLIDNRHRRAPDYRAF